MKRIFGVLLCFLLVWIPAFAEGIPEAEGTIDDTIEVVIVRYDPADWNGGYGHYELALRIPPERIEGIEEYDRIENGKLMGLEYTMGDLINGGSTFVLTYGPTDGDDSPAQVLTYTYDRYFSDVIYVPAEEAILCSDLREADFIAFMDWLLDDFAEFSGFDENYIGLLSVQDEEFAVYSISQNKNCASALLRMLEQLPGALEGLETLHPELYEFMRSVS